MNVAFVTNLRAPYRTLQLTEYAKISNVNTTVYYTFKRDENRDWNTNVGEGFKEVDLKGLKISNKYGYINNKLVCIVLKNDLIIMGGYEQPTYIVLSALCRLLKKPYVLFFDGITTDVFESKQNEIKMRLKKFIITGSNFIMANGKIGRKYFTELFNYPAENIFNQYLTVDSITIDKLYEDKEYYRKNYREKLGLNKNEKVIIYSGRLVSIKNVDIVIRAISKLKDTSITLLILGSGEMETELLALANKLNVKIIVTGFISDQEELFKNYFVGDLLILPSLIEPWGLVVNEAMFAGLPVIVSNKCGCVWDLVKTGVNGYTIDPFNVVDIVEKLKIILGSSEISKFGIKSRELISDWKFINSKLNLEKIIQRLESGS